MVTLDTNVWVRYLTNDDELQARRAMMLMEQSEAVFLPKTVLLELEWVLRAAYRVKPADIHRSLLHILGLPILVAESAVQVAAALDLYAQGYDFADAMHLASSDTTQVFYTFDEKFISKGRHTEPPVKVVPGK
ncbi:MAG: type II toxin-antitoxin system VapC family toxin [Desulfuromonadaceae bacterium]|nr:type II toxin-antitoxin system VapC family toxin [Desulfuromonadaceae bacterium]